MALTFTTGTINQPDAGSVGQAMVEKIRDDVSAHAAWELVEEFTAGSGTVRWYVFKCLAASSGLPDDFFVVIGRTLSNGELRIAICEEYNPTGHVMSKYGHNSGGYLHDADGCQPNTFTLSTATFSGASQQPKYTYWIPGGTSTKWWIVVADDGFTVAFNGPSNAFFSVGAYIPLTELSLPVPLMMIGYNDSQGSITRNPAVAGITPSVMPLTIEGGGGSSAGSYGPYLGFMGELRYNDKLQNNQRPMAEQGIVIYLSGTRDRIAEIGWALGKQKRMRLTNAQAPAGFAFGDAYAMAGTLWVPFKPDDGRVWDTGVAAS
jgi:hypothetical protein